MCLVTGEKPQRRGSVGSLDSGMSVSFQPTNSTRMEFQNGAAKGGVTPKPMNQQQSFLGGLFHKRERKLSRSEDTQKEPFIRSTEV